MQNPDLYEPGAGGFQIYKINYGLTRNGRRAICVKKMRAAFLAKKKLPKRKLRKERQKGVEPSSSAWKAEIISRYMTAASNELNI